MKQKDFALVGVMAFVAIVAALILSHLFFSSPKDRQQKAEVVDVITPDFAQPSRKYFNAKSVNPTQQIEIGGSSNPNPFNVQAH